MDLAISKLGYLSKEKYVNYTNGASYLYIYSPRELIHKYQVQIKVIGKVSMLSKEAQEAIREAEKLTEHYTRYTLILQ